MRIPHSIALGPLFVFWSFSAYGQPPEFEAADIRVNPSGDPPAAQYLPGGQMTLHSMTMKLLIGLAWKETRILPEFTALSVALHPAVAQFSSNDYLKGGPPWLDSDRFDVIAKAPAGTPTDTVRLMLQKLLADRFHLTVHQEQKTVKVYVMTVAKGGPKLNPAQGGDPVCIPSIGSDNVYHRDCHNMAMARLAEQLPSFAPRFFEGKPVVDSTDLQGAWDFRLDWTPLRGGLAGLQPGAGQEFDTGTTIFRTMEKNLGLKLEQRERAMPVLVIDRVDRVASAN